jgi:hypothetical protein
MQEAVVAAHIELSHPQRVGCGFRDGLERRTAGAEHVGDAEGLRGGGDGGSSARSEKKQRTSRRQQQRQSQPPSEPFDRGIHSADVAQHAGSEGDGVQRQPIAPERGLGLGPAHQGVPNFSTEILASLPDNFVQVLELVRACAAGRGAFFVVHFVVLSRSGPLVTSVLPRGSTVRDYHP